MKILSFLFNDTATTEIYTLSLHDALPIWRDLIALLKLGYRVEGLDVGPRAIALARRILEKEDLSTELHTGPIEAVALPGSFDVFTFSWFCYGYIPQADTRIGVLRKVKAHLNPGGRVLISYVPAERP